VLLSIPGVGPVVASVVRGTIGDARDFKNASTFRAYTGLIPREDSSGDAQRRGRISKAGPTCCAGRSTSLLTSPASTTRSSLTSTGA
jgi:transposase